MRKNIIICFLLICSHLHSQFIDTLRLAVKGKYSIDARLESRNSFIDNKLNTVSGARLGLSFRQKLRFGLGAQWLSSETKKLDFNRNQNFKIDTNVNYLKWAYMCAYIDFVFYKTKRWQLSVPIQIGMGQCWWQNESRYNLRTKNPKYFVFVYEPGITAQFKIFRWLGLGSDVAYRFCIKNNNLIPARFSGPTYSFKLLFWADQLFYVMFPEHKLSKRFGPAFW